jgi:predicted acyltransferase
MVTQVDSVKVSQRLMSLDFMRGLIMVLLALESTQLYDHFSELSKGTAFYGFFQQFFHHPWHGLHFWDLIQPAFMFMAGVAMAYSLHKQKKQGLTWQQSFGHVLKRSGWLFFWGVLDYAVKPNGLSFLYWDVLTQLAFTSIVAFLLFNFPVKIQVIICILILLLTEFLYRYISIPGFDQPFTNQHNFGNYMDMILMNRINGDGWVAINCIPTSVHTIAGAIVGKLLLSGKHHLKVFLIAGLVCLAAGYALDGMGITPIIKKIATSSFILVSLGWCLLILSACYWRIDVKQHRKHLKFFIIVGMNSLFIYLFFEIVASRWFNNYISIIIISLADMVRLPHLAGLILASLTIFALEWLMCYFLYRKKIFFRA